MTEKEIDELARMVRDYLKGNSYDVTVADKFNRFCTSGKTVSNDPQKFLLALKREMKRPEVIGRTKMLQEPLGVG